MEKGIPESAFLARLDALGSQQLSASLEQSRHKLQQPKQSHKKRTHRE
jgi:hypothetical protein